MLCIVNARKWKGGIYLNGIVNTKKVNNVIKEKRKFDMRDTIGFCCGSLGNELIFDFIGAFLMVFYTDSLGISPALTGSLLVVARSWDAFMDVVAGRFADCRPNTPNGKYKPLVFKMCIPMFIFAVLMFVKIPGLSGTALIIYAFATYIIFGTVHSFVAIPFGASASVISTDSSERAILSTYRTIGANAGQMIINTIIPIVAFVDNKLDADKTSIVVIIMCLIGIVCYYIYYKLTEERLIVHKKEKLNMLRSVKGLAKNRPFISLVVLIFILLISNTVITTLNAYLYKDYFQNTKALSFNGIIMILNIVILAPLVSPLSKRIGKKELASLALLWSCAGYFLLFILPIKNPYLFVVLAWFSNAGMIMFNFMAWAFVSDVADYQEILTNQREDGTILAIYQYARKLGQSVAVGVAGFALTSIGYIKGIHQTIEVAAKIRNIATLAPAILFFVVFLALTFWYPMSRKRLEQLQIDLEAKRSENKQN